MAQRCHLPFKNSDTFRRVPIEVSKLATTFKPRYDHGTVNIRSHILHCASVAVSTLAIMWSHGTVTSSCVQTQAKNILPPTWEDLRRSTGFTVKFRVVHSAFLLWNYSKEPVVPNLSQIHIQKDVLILLFLRFNRLIPAADDTGT